MVSFFHLHFHTSGHAGITRVEGQKEPSAFVVYTDPLIRVLRHVVGNGV